MVSLAAAQQYKDDQISFASPGQLVLMLYDGAIKFLESALQELSEKNDLGKKARLVEKASHIIDYLQSCLDKEKGGQIAENFDRLYSYMLIELTQANFYNDAGRIKAVIKLIQPLRDAWAEILKNSSSVERQAPRVADFTAAAGMQEQRRLRIAV